MLSQASSKPAVSRVLLALILVSLIIGTAATTYALSQFGKQTVPCDTTLSSQIGLSGQICLRPLNVVTSNTSQTYVPVLIVKAGTNATISILYHNTIKSTTAKPQLPNLTSSSPVYAVSLGAAAINITEVGFSHGIETFENRSWTLYNYTLHTSSDAAGYYIVLPTDYYGFYPALVVEKNINTALNKSELAMWGYTGRISSAEFILPSTIVGTTNAKVVNVTVPPTPYCPDRTCTLITHSVF